MLTSIDTSTPQRPLGKGGLSALTAVLLLIWLLWNSFGTVRRIISFYTPLPVTDYWRIVENLPAYENLGLGVLWMQHNEHRIVFPEIVFGLDMRLAHGCMVLPLTLSFLCYAATWLVLSSAILQDVDLPRTSRLIICLLAGVIALFETAALVLAVPFLLQWTLMQFAAACSLAFLSRANNQRSGAALSKSIIMASVATYSSAAGLLLWPLLICIAVFRRFHARPFSFLCAGALANTALYFVHYRFSHQLNLVQPISHPVYLLKFICSYLSMPFGGMKAPAFGISLGLLSLTGAIVCFAAAWRGKLLAFPPAAVLFGHYAFTVLAAVMTAAGRIDLADQSFFAAKAVRYISVPQMNWAALVLLVLWLLMRLDHRKTYAAVATFFVLSFCVGFIKLDRWVTANAKPFAKAQEAALSLQNGQFDPELIRNYVNPDPSLVKKRLALLEAAKLSIYYKRTR